ncbi:MAG: hypothetical protein ACO1OB_06725 [Archangium sp.]
MNAPRAIELFVYQVGFGDCVLMRFVYEDHPRHVLVDFGSASTEKLLPVAEDIAGKVRENGGTLEAIVASTLRTDHVSGFGIDAAWRELETLKPKLVLRPHTKHDASAREFARTAQQEVERRGAAVKSSDDDHDELSDGLDTFGVTASRALRFITRANVETEAAERNLARVKRQERLSLGDATKLEALLPGVRVHVLGPPKPRRDDGGYLGVSSGAVSWSNDGTPLFPHAKKVKLRALPKSVRWFTRRLDTMRGDQLLELVRSVDDTVSNASLILLFEACGKKLLFPGDAQAASWAEALAVKGVAELVRDVDVYKVGEHGSRNGTPRSLWNSFSKRGSGLVTVLSTMERKHGTKQAGTEVPRTALLEVLQAESKLVCTMGMKKVVEKIDVG